MHNHIAKHFALQLGSLISLYVSLSFLLVLLFGLINIVVPDATDSYWQIDNASTQVRLGIAILLVFFPTYLILTRTINKARRSGNNAYLSLTKWLIYISLLIAGIALLVDLVTVILAFLEGEVTTRFILKTLAVLVVIGAAFSYYVLDARNYWLENERKSMLFGTVSAAIVLACIVGGFMAIEGPSTARDRALDERQVSDLQEIEWQIENYLVTNETLPTSLESLYSGQEMPTAPEDRPDYSYNLTEDGFELCATFATDSHESDRPSRAVMRPNDSDLPMIVNPGDFNYRAGETCFDRTVQNINPETTPGSEA